jgi:hypothetical protein
LQISGFIGGGRPRIACPFVHYFKGTRTGPPKFENPLILKTEVTAKVYVFSDQPALT